MCFSPDAKFLLTLGGAPDWKLINWQWEKSKVAQQATVSTKTGSTLTRCSFCPADPSVVCVTGQGVLRFLHLEQADVKFIPFGMGKREPQNYTCHTWIDDRILIGTDTGDILVFENAEFRGVLESSPADGKAVECIAAYSKGFVCGGDDGLLYVFERDDKTIYRQSKSYQISGTTAKITSAVISPSEESVCCSLETSQAYLLGLSSTDLLKEEMTFEPVGSLFHHLQITGLDVCVRKPLVATCGTDKTVRIWNYLSRSLELQRSFPETPLSLAFHPSGFHLLVGFSDSLKLLHLLLDELKLYKEFSIKNCKECVFSNGGQYFAVANSSVVQVFSTYTCEMVYSLNLHKGKVRALHWSTDDTGLVSAGMDGCVYNWKIRDPNPPKPAASKAKCNYTCVSQTSDGRIVAVGSDRKMKIIDNNEVKDEIELSTVLTQVAFLHPRPPSKDKVLFAGTDTGVVRVMSLPADGTVEDRQVHSGAVTRMRISPDDQFLFTAGADGCLTIFAIGLREGAKEMKRLGREMALPWAEEILVSKAELEEKVTTISELQAKVDELTNQNAAQISRREQTCREKLKEFKDKYKTELDQDKKRYRSLEEEKANMEKQYALKVEALHNLQKLKLQELDSHFKHKLRVEEERYRELERKLQNDKQRWTQIATDRESKYTQEKDQLRTEYTAKLKQEIDETARLEAEKARVVAEFENTKRLIEEQADRELDELKAYYDVKLTEERNATIRLKEENDVKKRLYSSLKAEINKNLEELSKKTDKQKSLQSQISSLENDISSHKKEIKEREATIADKVNRIFELKKKNQELEKFKFVLDYKISELKRQVRPRELEMKKRGEQLGQMQTELKTYKKDSEKLSLEVKRLHLKLKGMEGEIRDSVDDREAVVSALQRFQHDLHEVYLKLENPKELAEGLKSLYQRHVTSELKGLLKSGEGDQHKDHQRQRKYLEKTIESLVDKAKKEATTAKVDSQRIMQENIILTKEINELRREIHLLRTNQHLRDSARASNGTSSSDMGAAIRRSKIEAEIEAQQEQIRALKSQLQAVTTDLGKDDKFRSVPRPNSSERLTPLDRSVR